MVKGKVFSHTAVTALFVSAFFDELRMWGVRDVVISPGSRSTALAMVAYEMSCRQPHDVRVYVDIDERGAAFFALGLAKASGRPACLICTSGTALANYYPAVLEAETSRVPLIILSGDRPAQLQGLGAPQTCDQLKAYGDHVRKFWYMPLPSAEMPDIAFARQVAREVCLVSCGSGTHGGESVAHDRPVAARGCCYFAGPVQVNFPFTEPLKPDLSVEELFAYGRRERCDCHVLPAVAGVEPVTLARLCEQVKGRSVVVLAGEGSCETEEEACELLVWAKRFGFPLLADPLSGLRCFDEPCVIDNYDNIFRQESYPAPDVVIRFGRWPISKSCAQRLSAAHVLQVVIDKAETRDFTRTTDVFVPCTPLEFARSMMALTTDRACCASQDAFLNEWITQNENVRERICSVEHASKNEEGAYVRKMIALAPEGSCIFSANSLSIRALDTFYLKQRKRLVLLCNRGQNGIDGTVSTALGAAQVFSQTTFLTGDFTLLHDLNALALQRELRVHHGGDNAPSIIIVLLNNNGGGIFDVLPQKSADPSFERLFLAPQDVDFAHAARAFDVPYCAVNTVAEFEQAYLAYVGKPGINVVEIKVPLTGTKERYDQYWY